MRGIIVAALAVVWVVKYDTYTGGNYVPCANSMVVAVGQNQFQQPLCISFGKETVEWPSELQSKEEAARIIESLGKTGKLQNLRSESRESKKKS